MKLPEHLIKRPDPVLRDIKIGETVFIAATDMQITESRDCLLKPTATFQLEKSTIMAVRVNRLEDGFHVAILLPHKWPALKLSSPGLTGWLPVVRPVEKYDSELDVHERLRLLERKATATAARLKDIETGPGVPKGESGEQ